MDIKYNLFPNGKSFCITMSFDDGRTYDRRLINIFNQYGIKGTFHLNSGFLDQEDYVTKKEVKDLYKGHEVACHTVTHPHLTELPNIQIIKEILEDKDVLEKLVGYPIRGISSPFGAYHQQVLEIMKMCGIEYNRTVKRTYQFNPPENFLEWHPTHHIRIFERDLFDQFFSNPFNEKKILYLWGHSYEFNDNNTWGEIEKVCQYLGNREDVWYATNIEIKDYLDALNRLVLSVDGTMFYNPSAIDVWVSINNQPIRIKANETKII